MYSSMDQLLGSGSGEFGDDGDSWDGGFLATLVPAVERVDRAANDQDDAAAERCGLDGMDSNPVPEAAASGDWGCGAGTHDHLLCACRCRHDALAGDGCHVGDNRW